MSIYWVRCDICGKYQVVGECTLHPLVNVCFLCCILCPERRMCSKPTWTTKIVKAPEEKKVKVKKEVEAVLQDLLKKLENKS